METPASSPGSVKVGLMIALVRFYACVPDETYRPLNKRCTLLDWKRLHY